MDHTLDGTGENVPYRREFNPRRPQAAAEGVFHYRSIPVNLIGYQSVVTSIAGGMR